MKNKGFVIVAQNTKEIDYIQCATVLAHSLKNVMPSCSVTLLTDQEIKEDVFDVIKIFGTNNSTVDPFNISNDYKVYDLSPYEYTIKLEADMYIPTSIEYFWDLCKHNDVVVSTTIRNFKQEISQNRTYRKFIDDNKLPDCYNGLTYFRKSPFAKEFFETVRYVFENWTEIKKTLHCNVDELATTDWVYALACHMLGSEKTTLPQDVGNSFSFVHMKQFINDLPSENWTDVLVPEILPHSFRINTIPQRYPIHYHVKSFAKDILMSLS